MEPTNKKNKWQWIIQLIISILTALATTLGTMSCVQYSPTTMTQQVSTQPNDSLSASEIGCVDNPWIEATCEAE